MIEPLGSLLALETAVRGTSPQHAASSIGRAPGSVLLALAGLGVCCQVLTIQADA